MEAINHAAVRIARKVAGDEALVAGTLCLTWQYRPGSAEARVRVRRLFDEQIEAQAAEGVDFFICETLHYVGEGVIAAQAIEAAGYPAMITLNFKATERSADGHEPEEVARILVGEGADIVGANCGRDPAHMLRGEDAEGREDRLHRGPAGGVPRARGHPPLQRMGWQSWGTRPA